MVIWDSLRMLMVVLLIMMVVVLVCRWNRGTAMRPVWVHGVCFVPRRRKGNAGGGRGSGGDVRRVGFGCSTGRQSVGESLLLFDYQLAIFGWAVAEHSWLCVAFVEHAWPPLLNVCGGRQLTLSVEEGRRRREALMSCGY